MARSGQRGSDGRAKGHRREVHDGGRERDPDEHGHRRVARREAERHELALVAQFSDEDDAEADEEGFDHVAGAGRTTLPG